MQNAISPTRSSAFVGTKSIGWSGQDAQGSTPYIVSGQSPSNVSIANYLWVGPGTGPG